MRSGTLSQWSSRRSGDVCSYFLAEKTSLAVAFNTDCKQFSWTAGAPANTVLQQSSLLITSARSNVSKAGRDRECRILLIYRNVAKHARTVAVTWARMVTSASTKTPRFRTTATGCIKVPPTRTGLVGI